MICTEKEAAGKWCPQARMTVGTEDSPLPAGVNRSMYGNPITMCIGSACMMWDWQDYEVETASEYVGPSHRPNEAGVERAEQRLKDGWEEYKHNDPGYRAFKRSYGERRRGTCGLIQRGGQ